jgi:hypothetical protein
VNFGCVEPLRATYRQHDFRHAWDEGLSGEKDIPLFQTLQDQRYDAIITKDRNQLRDESERRALLDAGLHWIGHKARGRAGLEGIALETATVTAGLIYVLGEWRNQPHVYAIKGIEAEAGQRLKISSVALAKWGLSSVIAVPVAESEEPRSTA